ncbi:MAG TPA: histidine--tRNA ligase [Thermoleophilaceae bacterium]|nr:histidine--tRNA ligase [Thermoleophilaceae bacterium]
MTRAEKLQAPRGTFDVLPEAGRRRAELLRTTAKLLEAAGYEPFEAPVLEDTRLFERGVGESTDIVQKEMFTFEDQGGRSLTLRPEGTAGVCRAYVEHGMHKLPQPVKLWYQGPFFRHEAPQAGRYRQFAQIGAEALGSEDPTLDAELILLLAELLERVGARGVRLRISSLGTAETRGEYSDELRRHLRVHEDELSEEVRARIDRNPLRAFDSDHPGTRRVMESAPRLVDRLTPQDREHLEAVRGLLEDAGCTHELDATLVRGLDYYTRTVFEFTSDALGAQSGLGGGGRYDGLVEELGGPPTPGVGWAAGVERVLLAAGGEARGRRPDVFVAVPKADRSSLAFGVLRELRRAGLEARMEQAGRSLKGQLKHADRLGARALVIVGDELEVKDMRSGDQRAVADVGEAVRLASEVGGAAVAEGTA